MHFTRRCGVKRIKNGSPARRVTQVSRGDFIKVGGVVKEISSNSAHGAVRAPRYWTIRTTDGETYGMFDAECYAKAKDVE